jgi:hypothetical protein
MLLPVRWNLIGGQNPERERLSTHVDDNQQQEQRLKTFRPALLFLYCCRYAIGMLLPLNHPNYLICQMYPFLVCLPPTGAFGLPSPSSIWNWTNNNRTEQKEQSLTLSVLPMASRLQSAGQQMKKKPLTNNTNGWKMSLHDKKSDDGWLKYRWRMYATNERKLHSSCPAWWRTFESHYNKFSVSRANLITADRPICL